MSARRLRQRLAEYHSNVALRTVLLRGPRIQVALCAGVIFSVVAMAIAASTAAAAPASPTFTFNYTGAAQMFQVPFAGDPNSLTLTLYGASGGSINGPFGSKVRGGSGAVAKGDVPVTPGEQLALSVGGSGANQVTNNSHNGWSAPGLQGGQIPRAGLYAGTGGGGASVVQIVKPGSPAELVAVAGGGGGSGGYFPDYAGAGGNAGAAPTQGGNGANSRDPHLGGSGGRQGGSSSSAGANAGSGTPSQFNPAGGGGGGGGGYPKGGASGGDASGADGGASGGGGGSGQSFFADNPAATIVPGASPNPGASYDGKIVIQENFDDLRILPPHTTLKVTPGRVRAGGKVRVFGAASGTCIRSGAVLLMSRAFIDTHAFRDIPTISVALASDGRFSLRTTIPKQRKPGSYRITGRCGRGSLGVMAHVQVLSRQPSFTG